MLAFEQSSGHRCSFRFIGERADDGVFIQPTPNLPSELPQIALKANVSEFRSW